MRVFLCDYSGFSLAIPMDCVCALTLCGSETPQDGNTYISLPALLDHPDENIRHGIIVKNENDENRDNAENRTVLLTTEVRCETEISDDEIYPLPKAFKTLSFSQIFTGMQIDSLPVLLLDPQQLIRNLDKIEEQKELTV